MGFLTQWLVHPWLLGAGLAAISVPILIHLLNRRRFRVVDWAAMEFLLAAQRKNRRRIRLEDWSLLLLRCFAFLCLALLLARPYMVSSLSAGPGSDAEKEHLVILDDSLSMQTHLGTETAFDRARRRLQDLCQQLSTQQRDHSLTIVRTSGADQPALDGARLNATTAGEVERFITELQPTLMRTQLARTLEVLNARLKDKAVASNRTVYVFSDLRAADWEETTTTQLRKLAEHSQAICLIDCGSDDDRNLSIIELQPDSPPTAGLPLAIVVQVKNQGSAAANDVQVSLTAGQSLPMHATIPRLGPHEIGTVSFQIPLNESSEKSGDAQVLTLKAALAKLAGASGDRLEADNIAWYSAPIRSGIRVLLVDGAPDPDERRSQSFFLRRALAPVGPIASGILVDVVSEEQLESASLDDYEVVFLLNTSSLGERAADVGTRLNQWVTSGGGLVIMLGDQADPATSDTQFSPIKLERIQGDERRELWLQLQVDETRHELLKHFAGPNNPLLASLKIFRWWQIALPDRAIETQVLARLTNAERSVAIIQAPQGHGQVVAFTFPADAAWTNWPAEPSYVLFMQDLVRTLSPYRHSSSRSTVGEPIETTIDITQYEASAQWIDPLGVVTASQAFPPPKAPTGDSTRWLLRTAPTTSAGIHRLQLKHRYRGEETRIIAANVDPAEGDLRRIDAGMRRALADSKIRFLESAADLTAIVADSKQELWHLLLVAVVVFLFAEQTLAWHLGRTRA